MKRTPLAIAGAFLLEQERTFDDRGFFARTYCAREFAADGLDPTVAQCSVSFNERRGTLRGMHYQVAPHTEAKTVACAVGAIFDVLLDTRPESPTYLQWYGEELSPENGRSLHIPAGVAHGFLTLKDASMVHYTISTFHEPSAARGVRWDDPRFGIAWPFAPSVISSRDASYPMWSSGPRG